jgi:glycine/D-amino acid oxidase-like deaminating enzyme/nitrite reductase/ring-hydroxylating ferredoxin subunit
MPDPSRGQGEAARADRVSFWVDSIEAPRFARLEGQAEAEVAVVGAGIVGLTTALLLAEAGKDVLVIEADRVAAGVSGYTTGKVTAGHGLIYSHLDQAFDTETARLYAVSQIAALNHIRELCAGRSIACDFEPQANFLFAETEADLEKLEEEATAARQAGLTVSVVRDLDIPVEAAGALQLDDQAQFHACKYLLGVASLVIRAGGRIVESARVLDIDGDGPYVLSADTGSVDAGSVVVASHYPIVEGKFFVSRIHPRRAYIVAAPLDGADLPGMFINVSRPTRSFRTTPAAGGGRLLLVGGEGHRVGQEDDTESRYAVLEGYMKEHFAVGETAYRWSTQDNFTLDRLPYVGRARPGEELFVATGFGGWGMTNGTAAALAITDAIQGRRNAWARIFSLDRGGVLSAARRFVSENVNVAREAIGGRLQPLPRSPDGLEPGEGKLISIDGDEVAVSRDSAGSLLAVSAVCTHMGCRVAWNPAEATWDCPCHGSRFAAGGRVLHGPAVKPLEAVDIGSSEAEAPS